MEYIIPSEWFHGSHSGMLVVLAVVGLYVLRIGAEWLVEGASGIAYRMGMPEVIVGATIVSLGTTTPECAVSVMAAWSGNPGLALGNAVGSVIADSALIFGIGCLLVLLPADKFVLARQGWVQFGSAWLLAMLCYGLWFFYGSEAAVTWHAGVVLLAMLAGYLFLSVRWARGHSTDELFRVTEDVAKHTEPDEEVKIVHSDLTKHTSMFLAGMALAGLVLVVVSGHVLIESVSVLAERVGIPNVVIAATLVALGTSLPELVVGITAIRKGHPELLVGNVLGADILNILFVTGAAAVAAPLPIVDSSPDTKLPEIFLFIHLPTMLIVLTYFRFCIFSATNRGHFQKWMGIPLLIAYVTYTVTQFAVSL